MVTQDQLKTLLTYNHETGNFTWLPRESRRFNVVYAGKIAGSLTYEWRQIMIFGRSYLAHRLAWLYVHGVVPEYLDHIDGNGANNALNNLRPATKQQNCRYRKLNADNEIGLKGVRRVGKKYVARINTGKKPTYLGIFKTKEQAHAAYCEAAKKHFGEFARTA